MYYKIILVFLLSFLLSSGCNSSAKNNINISQLGFYSSPEQIIEQLSFDKSSNKSSNQSSAQSSKALSAEENFLLGIAYKKQKDLKSALRCFADSAYKSHKSDKIKLYANPIYSFLKGYHIKSPYYDDAVNEIADIFLQYKEYEHAQKIAKLAGNSSPRISIETALTIASSLSELKKNNEAIQLLSNKLQEQNSQMVQSILYMKRAAFYEKDLNYKSAINDYMSIIELSPENWRAGISAQRIYSLISKDVKDEIDISEDILIAATRALIKNKNYSEAEFLNSKVDTNCRKIEYTQNKVKLLIKNNQQAAYEAINIYSKDSTEYQNMLYFFAEEIRLSKNRKESIPYYDMLTSSQDKNLKLKSLLQIGNIYEREDSPLYKEYYERYISLNGDPTETHRMFWLMARRELKERNNEEAKRLLLKSIDVSSDGSYSARVYFWLYKVFSEEGNSALAEKALSNLIVKHPSSVYSWAALDTLPSTFSKDNLKKLFNEAKNSSDADKMLFLHSLMFFTDTEKNTIKNRMTSLPASVTDPYSKLENYITKTKGTIFFETQKYFAIGSTEYINKTLDYIPENKDLDEIKFAALTKLAYEFDNPALTVSNMVKLMKAMSINENLALMGNTSIKAIIPQGYDNFVISCSKTFSVPQNLIYSIIKAESMFDHQAVSSAGAAGLMQLMPATAAGLAKQLKISQYSLTNPKTSIEFGAAYTAWLNRYYKDKYIFTVAAYNAGLGNVDKWKKSLDTEDMDYFTEFVPFAETNYYIVRTGKFYKQYNLIYGNK